ncbi:MAG: hypothetical protein KFF73_01880 [Cyclobacteriaceae bacterium]|nr:hypothetical protein [Cyclobacteriaceae bacterium]
MKFFRVRFTTEYEMTPFGEVPAIIESSGLLGVDLALNCGGWNKGESSVCYHEWKSESNPETIKNFLVSRYGKSLINICINDLPAAVESSLVHGDRIEGQEGNPE